VRIVFVWASQPSFILQMRVNREVVSAQARRESRRDQRAPRLLLPGATRAESDLRKLRFTLRREKGRMSGSLCQWVKSHAVAGLVAVAAVAWAASAGATSGMEPRVGRDECRTNVPGSITIQSNLQQVQKRRTIELTCPANKFFWNWSATVSPHVQITMMGLRKSAKGRVISGTFLINRISGDAVGLAQIYLGCSAPHRAGSSANAAAGMAGIRMSRRPLRRTPSTGYPVKKRRPMTTRSTVRKSNSWRRPAAAVGALATLLAQFAERLRRKRRLLD